MAKILPRSIYVLLEEGTTILPGVELKFVTEKDLPKKGDYFVIANNGIFIHKSMEIVESKAKVETIAGLAKSNTFAKLNLKKIPSLVLSKAHSFFAMVYKKYHAESEVMLLYDTTTQEYDLWCPQQEVSGGSVHYELSQEAINIDKRWRIVGTIHSHCNFSAYHSSVDVNDEKDQDGVHITIGHVNSDAPSVECSIVVNSNRFKCGSLSEIAADVEQQSKKQKFYRGDEGTKYYSFQLKPEERVELSKYEKEIKTEWMTKVKNGFGRKSKNYMNNWFNQNWSYEEQE